MGMIIRVTFGAPTGKEKKPCNGRNLPHPPWASRLDSRARLCSCFLRTYTCRADHLSEGWSSWRALCPFFEVSRSCCGGFFLLLPSGRFVAPFLLLLACFPSCCKQTSCSDSTHHPPRGNQEPQLSVSHLHLLPTSRLLDKSSSEVVRSKTAAPRAVRATWDPWEGGWMDETGGMGTAEERACGRSIKTDNLLEALWQPTDVEQDPHLGRGGQDFAMEASSKLNLLHPRPDQTLPMSPTFSQSNTPPAHVESPRCLESVLLTSIPKHSR